MTDSASRKAFEADINELYPMGCSYERELYAVWQAAEAHFAGQLQEFYDTLHKYWPGTINELVEEYQRLNAAQSSHEAEREALVRQCAEICHRISDRHYRRAIELKHEDGEARFNALSDGADECEERILALLNSGSQG